MQLLPVSMTRQVLEEEAEEKGEMKEVAAKKRRETAADARMIGLDLLV